MSIKLQKAANIIGHWDMRTGSVRDLTGNGADGTFVDTPYFSNEIKGRTLNFDGVDDAVNCGTSPFYTDSSTSITIVATTEILPGDFDGDIKVLLDTSSADPNANGGFYIAFDDRGGASPTNGIIFNIKTATAHNLYFITNNVSGDNGKYHLVFTYDGATDTGKIYINGVDSSATGAGGGSGNFVPRNANLYVGSSNTPNAFYPKNCSEVMFLNTVLTAQEASELYEEHLEEASVTEVPTSTSLPENVGDCLPANLALHYTGRIQTNKLLDISGGGNDTAALANTYNLNGFFKDKLTFVQYPTCATASTFDLSAATQVTVSFLLHAKSVATTQQLLELSANQNNETDSFSIFIVSSKLSCAMTDAGGSSDVDSSVTLVNGTTYHCVATFDKTTSGADMVDIWVNAVEGSTAGGSAATGGGNFGNRTFYLGARGGSSFVALSELEDIKVHNTKLTQAQIDELFAVAQKKVDYYQNGKDWNVSVANVTANFLENTGWTVNTGTWKVSDNGVYKVLECVADGQLQRPLEGASLLNTTTFETVSGTPTLTKNTSNLQIDAVAGEKVGIITLKPFA